MKKVVLLSGGLDSATCLGFVLNYTKPEDVLALNMYYGQRHVREMQSAHDVAAYYGVELMELDLSEIFARSDCSLLTHSGKEIAHQSYADQIKETGSEKPVSTYVPFRNGLMLSTAASVALSIGADEVIFGAHADDAAGCAYPDCSEQFAIAMNKAIQEGTAGQVSLTAPFITANKAQVVNYGLKNKVPYNLTWSCYEGGDRPCGKCGTCIDRAKAFEANGAADPALI